MRLLSCAAALVVFVSLSFSQIPNAGFENWVTDIDSDNDPVGWQTSNSFPSVSVEPFTPGHEGSFAMKVKVLDLGVVRLHGIAFVEARATFPQTPTKLGAWVRSTIMPGDTAIIIVALFKGDTIVAATDSCTFKISTSYAVYTYLEFPIASISGVVPDSLTLVVTSGLNVNPQAGTELIVDDLAFIGSGPVSVPGERNLPDAFLLDQNYPNPFNPETVISYQLSVDSKVSLTVYDLLGRTMQTLVDETKPAGMHEARWNASRYPSGVYFYKLEAGEFLQVKRMMLIR